jgi:hypothetical protein
VTALPASPVDGQKCILVDSLTAPTWQWNLQYVAAKATNKWIVLGATPLFDEVVASQTTASTTYANLGTVGPQIQLPVAGDYMVRQGASMKIAGTSTTYYMSYDIGATAAVDADAVIALPGTAGDPGFSVMRSRKKLALGAVLLVAKYRVGAGAAAPFSNRWMEVEPIAVGG